MKCGQYPSAEYHTPYCPACEDLGNLNRADDQSDVDVDRQIELIDARINRCRHLRQAYGQRHGL